MKIEVGQPGFAGEIPRVEPVLLPGNVPTVAVMAKLLTGDLEAWREPSSGMPLPKTIQVLTSPPYAAFYVEGVDSQSLSFEDGRLAGGEFITGAAEAIDVESIELLDGALRTVLHQYAYTEAIDIEALDFTDATLRSVLISYLMEAEAIDMEALQFSSGSMRVALIQYQNYPVEAIDIGALQFISGSLT